MNDWKARLHVNNNYTYARLIIRKSQQRLSRQHFSYLTTDDLNNNAAMVNHACSEAKSNESLDQMRTATIIYYLFVRLSRDPPSPPSTLLSIMPATL
jgi:hypothetical protein